MSKVEVHRCSTGSCEFTLEFDEGETSSKPFVPQVRIKKLDESSILIETYALKDVALTLCLFRILEEDEKLEIVFENQRSTQTEVSHTLYVKVQEGYNIEALEKKLCTWAGKPT